MVPSGLFAPGSQTAPGLPVSAQQIEGQAPQQGHIVRHMASPDATLIFAQRSVQRVLIAPVTVHGQRQAFILGRQTGK